MKTDFTNLKNTFARYVTGVTVVSCQPPGNDWPAVGMTVNSFSSVSLEPPLVLWCLDRQSTIFESFAKADNFAVSILQANQADVSARFATPGQHHFKPEESERWISGAPLLTERLGGLDCKVEDRHDAGDHVILVGRVIKFDYRDGSPLMYVGRKYEQGSVIK